MKEWWIYFTNARWVWRTIIRESQLSFGYSFIHLLNIFFLEPFTPLFIHSSVPSFICSCVHPVLHSLVSTIPPFLPSFLDSFLLSLFLSFVPSFLYSFIHPLTQLAVRSFIQSKVINIVPIGSTRWSPSTSTHKPLPRYPRPPPLHY